MYKKSLYELENELDEFYKDDEINNTKLRLLLKFSKLSSNLDSLKDLKILEPSTKKVDKVIIHNKIKKDKKGLF